MLIVIMCLLAALTVHGVGGDGGGRAGGQGYAVPQCLSQACHILFSVYSSVSPILFDIPCLCSHIIIFLGS
jgi:hypothetical protein